MRIGKGEGEHAAERGKGERVLTRSCAPAAHEAAPPTGCRLDRDAAAPQKRRDDAAGARRTRVRRAVLRAAYASQGVGVLQMHGSEFPQLQSFHVPGVLDDPGKGPHMFAQFSPVPPFGSLP